MVSADATMCYACGSDMGGGKEGEEAATETDAKAEETEKTEEDEIACTSCGTMISSDATMCYACGAEMGGGGEAGAEAPPEEPKKAVKPVAKVKKVVKKRKVL